MKNPSFDLNVRYLDFDGRKIEIDYISSLCSDELIAYLVEGITNAKGKTLKDCLNNGDVKEELNKENYEYAMLTGCAIVKDIDKSKVIKKGMLLGFIIGIIRLLPINFGVHSILSMVALGVILFKCSNNDIIKSMVSTCLVWLSLALSEGIYVLIATNILNIKIEKLMDNSSLQGAIITLPSLVIMFLIVIILKYIKDDILKFKVGS